tara:strand:+ start:8079 stop:8624 length:546 start_codon:yes stop_codon:yes gene_type:complete
MTSLINYLNVNGLGFLTSNIFGLYLPLLITLVLLFKARKELFKKENIILFLVGLIGGYIFSYGQTITQYNYINGEMIPFVYEQFHSVNVFGVLYLLYFTLPLGKKINFNFSILWSYSFLTLWLTDGFYAYTEFNQHWFSSSIGGAGILDGLLLTPIVTVIGGLLIKLADNRKRKQNELTPA